MSTSTPKARMKVGTALGLGFALVILMSLVVAGVGSLQLRRVSQQVDLLVQDRLVKVGQVAQIKDNLNTQARAVRNILLTDERAVQDEEKNRIEQVRTSTGALLKTLEATLNLEQGRELFKKVVQARDEYNPKMTDAINYAVDGQVGLAQMILNSEGRTQQAAFFQALDEFSAFEVDEMRKVAKGAEETAGFTTLLLLATALAAALVGAVVAFFLTRSITRGLGGEPGYASEVAQEIAAGNLAVRVHLRPGDTTSLLAQMRVMRENLAQVVGQVRQGSEAVASASAQIAHGNQDLSGRTENQAAALEETAASMEELGSTVRHNADNARQANQLAQSATSVAVQGGEVVSQVIATMEGIDAASKKIADIINVIDGIAFQTNILALNAAVEAARAGEQGRGFAVVAGEVRALAGRSAEAAKEIKNLITDSVQRVEQGSTLVNQAGDTMQEVVQSIRRVTDIMGEISAASQEQSQGVSQVGEAVSQMDQTTQQNAALVEEMSAAATSLNQQAQDLLQAVSVFQLSDRHQQGTHHGGAVVQAGKPPVVHTPPPAQPRVALPPAAPRLAAKAVPTPAPESVRPARPAKAQPPSLTSSARAATDDDWESF